MPKPLDKPVPPIPGPPAARPGRPSWLRKAANNPRLQPDNRWQRSKRYGWDGR